MLVYSYATESLAPLLNLACLRLTDSAYFNYVILSFYLNLTALVPVFLPE